MNFLVVSFLHNSTDVNSEHSLHPLSLLLLVARMKFPYRDQSYVSGSCVTIVACQQITQSIFQLISPLWCLINNQQFNINSEDQYWPGVSLGLKCVKLS